MARRPISWDVNDPLTQPEKAQDTPSRTDAKRARVAVEDALARLAKELVELPARRLEQMTLPEDVSETVLEAQAIESAQAKSRQLRVVRSALRHAEWSLIRARLDSLLERGTEPSARGTVKASPTLGRESEWVVRLLGEGSEALEALIERYPNADRNHLRALVRNVQKSSGERRTRAEHRLAHAVRQLLRDA